MSEKRKFEMGNLYQTMGINSAIQNAPSLSEELSNCLRLFANGDWGDMDTEDCKLNDEAIANGDRIFGAYETSVGRIWIITESDRSATTILFPHEY